MVSELLGKAAVDDGLSVRGSEALGMAVRGGSVVSAIRIGSEVYGPLIPAGRADMRPWATVVSTGRWSTTARASERIVDESVKVLKYR